MNDLISRQAAIDFIDAGHLVNPNEPRWSDNEVINFLKSRPSAQPDVPDTNVGDMISRQAAIDALHMHLMYRMGTDSNKKRLDEWINNLPSAQPGIIRCKDCKHRPFDGEDTQGFGVEFPDEKCPCQCEDGWYNWRPNNEWFCANAERRTDVKADKGASS